MWAKIGFFIAWISTIFGTASGLQYPWSLITKLVGVIAPFFWFKALEIDICSLLKRSSSVFGVPAKSKQTIASRILYFVLGTAIWAIFVASISRDPERQFQPALPLSLVSGFLFPILLSYTVHINREQELCCKQEMRTTNEIVHSLSQTWIFRNILNWVMIQCAWFSWCFYFILGPAAYPGTYLQALLNVLSFFLPVYFFKLTVSERCKSGSTIS